jgi:hypothetical protein
MVDVGFAKQIKIFVKNFEVKILACCQHTGLRDTAYAYACDEVTVDSGSDVLTGFEV